jgi:putative N-acetylmannosamine-6-phosphate epimerase
VLAAAAAVEVASLAFFAFAVVAFWATAKEPASNNKLIPKLSANSNSLFMGDLSSIRSLHSPPAQYTHPSTYRRYNFSVKYSPQVATPLGL